MPRADARALSARDDSAPDAAAVRRVTDRLQAEVAGLLEKERGARLMRMVGFRNVAIHDYQQLNLDIVQAMITDHLGDFEAFAKAALRAEDDGFEERG